MSHSRGSSDDRGSKSALEALPPELLRLIFSKVDRKKNLSLVSKRFRAIVLNVGFNIRIFSSDVQTRSDVVSILRLLKAMKDVDSGPASIFMTRFRCAPDIILVNHFRDILRSCRGTLQHLSLNGEFSTELYLSYDEVPELKKLTIGSANIGFDHHFEVPRSLEDLGLYNCSLSTYVLDFLSSGCRGLRTLGIKDCEGVVDKGLSFFLHRCHGITTLKLKRVRRITANPFRQLGNTLRHLKLIEVENCAGVRRMDIVCDPTVEVKFVRLPGEQEW
jgi:hypothetical protein